MLNGAYLFSSLRLLEGTVVLILDGTTLFPGEDGLLLDVVSVMNPLFHSPFFFLFNQTFNLNFLISCDRQTKDVSLGERGHYGWTRVSTPPEPPALVGPPLLIPTNTRT